MHIDYIAQPDTQLGNVLSNMLDANPPASSIIFVSAFVSVQTIMRVKRQILGLKESGSDIRFVLGIDLGGTSREVLAAFVRPLVNAGGDLGDVVRIRRIAEPDAEYEYVLARQGTLKYKKWIKACTQPVRSSTRSFGYA